MIGRGSTPAVPLPLVVFRDVAYCGRDHEVTMITDGHRAYARGDTTDCGPVLRDGTTLVVDCGQPLYDDEPCDSRVEFRLDSEGTWTADPKARRTLADYGTEVER